jgi:hypothetical protein
MYPHYKIIKKENNFHLKKKKTTFPHLQAISNTSRKSIDWFGLGPVPIPGSYTIMVRGTIRWLNLDYFSG